MAQTIKTVLSSAHKRLLPVVRDVDQAWLEAELLLSFMLKKDRTWLIAHAEKQLTKTQQQTFDRLVARRVKREPLAYLLGTAPFYGREFFVDKHVLIPRPETEDLVRLAMHLASRISHRQTLVCDIGTGSGALAVTNKKECPDVTIFASDVDAKALAIAKKNAKKMLKRASAITFFRGDLLTPKMRQAILKRRPKHLLLIANLPYLPLSDKKKLDRSVVAYEPPRALFAKDDGLSLIKKLLQQAFAFSKKLKTPFSLLLEFDPPQAAALKRLAQYTFPNARVAVHKDSCGRDRILEIQNT